MPDEEGADRAYKWLFAVSLAAGCAALLLIALFYWRHPDRRLTTDFQPAPPRGVSGNGSPSPDPGRPVGLGDPSNSQAGESLT